MQHFHLQSDSSDMTANTLELRRNLKDTLRNKQDLIKSGACKHDTIRLGVAGWKSRFYREKFGVEIFNEVGKLKNDMVQKYLEGLCWVLQYYFADVPSWSRYYPFYDAPFASDLKGLSQFNISFTVHKPLRPFDQLMAVLPQESSFALPKCYRKLMENEESSVQKFYPSGIFTTLESSYNLNIILLK
jgi:5'-3' exonuclease